MRPLACLRLLALALCAGPAALAAAPEPQTPTPEEFLKQYVAAEKESTKLDSIPRVIELMRSFVAERSRPLLRSIGDMSAAIHDYGAAVEAKFGKDPSGLGSPFDLKPGGSQIVSVELKDTKELAKDKVLLTVWRVKALETATKPPMKREELFEEHLLLVKEGGNWRLVLGSPFLGGLPVKEEKRKTAEGKEVTVRVRQGDDKEPTAEELARAKESADRATTAIRALMKDVEAGKLKDRKEAEAALLRTLSDAFMPK